MNFNEDNKAKIQISVVTHFKICYEGKEKGAKKIIGKPILGWAGIKEVL